jgi:hypothetical protein
MRRGKRSNATSHPANLDPTVLVVTAALAVSVGCGPNRTDVAGQPDGSVLDVGPLTAATRDAWTDAPSNGASRCAIDAATYSFLGEPGYALASLPSGSCSGDRACAANVVVGPMCHGSGQALDVYTCECVRAAWDCVRTSEGTVVSTGNGCDGSRADANSNLEDAGVDAAHGDARDAGDAALDGAGAAHDAADGGVFDAANDTGVVTLAQSGPLAIDFAVDDTTIYLLNEDGVITVPLGGGFATTLATEGAPYPAPAFMALAGDNVVWTDELQGVMTCPKSGCGGVPVNLSATPAAVLASFGSELAWGSVSSGDDNSVSTCDVGGCGAQQTLWNAGEADALAMDATNAYWVSSNIGAAWLVDRCPLAGCNGTPLKLASGSGAGPIGLAIDSGAIYWIEGEPYLGGGGGGGFQTLKKLPIAGGSVVTLVTGINDASALASDGTNVYWDDIPDPNTGLTTVTKVAVDGGDPVTVATGEENAIRIVLDATNVYWLTDGATHSVRRHAK